MDSIDLTRRQILLSGAVSGLLGAGVTGSVGLSDITGESSIQAEQALELVGVTAGSADSDTSFTRVSDDDTTFGAAIELNNGDSSEILIDIHNNSSAALKTQATIKKPSSLSVSPRIADDDDLQGDNEVIQTGKDTYVFTIPAQRTIQFILTVSVPDTASSDASDVQMSFDPLSTSKDENPSTDSGPIITNAKLSDTVDRDGVVSAGETVRVKATVTEFNGLKSVETSAQEFDPDSEPITLTDDGPGVSQSDDKFSAEFTVGENADEGENRKIGITASDNEGVITEETANSLDINKTVETDNDAPTVSDISLTDNTDEDGVVSTDDEVEITATVTDAETSQEITTITADAGDFGAGTVTLYDTDSPTGNSGGGTRTESATFTVGSDSDATEGTGQTITLTVEDENGDKITGVDAAAEFNQTLEVDNDAPTVSVISLTDNTDGDGVVSTDDEVKVEAKVTDAKTSQEVTKITADAGDFGAGTVTLYDTDSPTGNSDAGDRTESATFTVGSDSNATATEGIGQTITLTVEDENGDEITEDAAAAEFNQTLEVDNDAPTIESATLTDAPAPDSDGVVSDGEQVKVEATVEDASNAGEITKVTADASAFGAGTEIELSNTDTSDDAEASGGGERTVSDTFTVGSDSNATEGSQTVTVTATDEEGTKTDKPTNSLEIDNDAPTVSDISLTDDTDGDGVVSTDDEVKVEATVEDAETSQEITTITADAGDFGAGTVTLYDEDPPTGNSGGETRTESDIFTVGSDSDATATEGTDQTITLTVRDENGDETTDVDAAADRFDQTLTVDTSVPTIGSVTLSSQSGIDGVADVGDTIRVTAEGVSETTTDVAEVKVSDNPFRDEQSRDEQITLSDDGPGVDPDDNAYSEEFEVSSNATPGESDTLTVTVTDEAGNTASKNSDSDSLIIPPGTDNLVSYWKLDDVTSGSGEANVTDHVGQNTGTIVEDQGTPDNVSSTSIQATGTSAARFKHVPDANTGNVNNGYIDCGSDASLDVGNEFTVSAYFKPTDLSEEDAALDEGIVSRDTGNVGSDERIWSLRVKEGRDTVIFAVANESGEFKQAETDTDDTIEDDATYHAIGRFDGQDLDLSVREIANDGNVGSQDNNLYVSDDNETNVSFPGSVDIETNPDVPLRIGFYYADNARTMDGVINEVKLFETRLSDSDVDALHTITE